MNNPDNFSVDIEEMRDWINAHKEARGLSWTELSRASGIPAGTLSPFAARKYGGDEANIARKVFKYRQMIESQQARAVGLPIDPGFVKTPTAMRFRSLLIMAQRGRMTMGASSPGTGKTMTIVEYQASVSNVWLATMNPACATLSGMISQVQLAVTGNGNHGWNRLAARTVAGAMKNRNGLLVVDEANHLTLESLEQLRAWHDETGVGIALFGNEELWRQIRGGGRNHQFARLNSRISMSHLVDLPQPEDVEMFLDAWGIRDEAMRVMLTKVGRSSGTGGLREIKQIIEIASLTASDEERALSLSDLRDAQQTRASHFVRT